MKQEIPQLVKLDQQAMRLKNAGQWDLAARLFEQILLTEPNWEHGYGAFNLAECYEELNRISDARSAYERAVASAPPDRTLLGGLASFLFLHGEPHEAFDQHIRLLLIERKLGDIDGVSATTTALRSLGSRLELSPEEIELRIAETPPALKQ